MSTEPGSNGRPSLRRLPIRAWLRTAIFLCLAPYGNAQDPEAEAKVQKRACSLLISCGDHALRNKVGPRARRAYQEVIQTYDKDHKRVHRKLGHVLVDGRWMPAKPTRETANSRNKRKWQDAANDAQRYQVTKRWHRTRLELAKLHRQHGL